MRQLKQVGVDYVLMGGPRSPWTEASLGQTMDRYKAAGITVINLMIGGMNDIIRGRTESRPGDREHHSLDPRRRQGRSAGHRVQLLRQPPDGRLQGRDRPGGAGYTAYDYELSKNLPPSEGVGTHTRADQLKRAEYFLKAIIPEAEKANVRFALHPNDPPVPISRGSEQLMDTVEHWMEYLNLVKSPYNGMTFDCGVTRETGADPVKVCRMLGERDCINHVHFRNVVVRKPYVDYTEVFLDEGQVDMFAVMKELVRQKYPRGLYPEHPRALDIDRDAGHQEPVSRRRRVRRRNLQRRLRQGDAAGSVVVLTETRGTVLERIGT